MDRLNALRAPAADRPVRVLQFGEGNFLRAFVDYFIDIANEKTDFNGSIVLVKPIKPFQLFPAFKEQDYRYTVMLRGLVDNEPVELIDDNGIKLHECVEALAKIWNLGEKFEAWLEEACVFTSTLVDRIVTGYPRGED